MGVTKGFNGVCLRCVSTRVLRVVRNLIGLAELAVASVGLHSSNLLGFRRCFARFACTCFILLVSGPF